MDSKKQEFVKSQKRENINESNPLITLGEVFDDGTEFAKDITIDPMEFCDVVLDNEINDEEIVDIPGISFSVEDITRSDEYNLQDPPHIIYIEGIPFEVDFTCDATILCEAVGTNDISAKKNLFEANGMLVADIPSNMDVSDGMLTRDMKFNIDSAVDEVVGINQEIKYDKEIAASKLTANRSSYKDTPLNVCADVADDESVTFDDNALVHEDTTDEILAKGSQFNTDVRDVLLAPVTTNNEDYTTEVDISDGAISVGWNICAWHTQCIDEFVASNVSSIDDRHSCSDMEGFPSDADEAMIDSTFEQLDEIEPSCLWLNEDKDEIVD